MNFLSLVPVLADPRRLAQALRNLLSNALRHTPSGGVVRVEVEPDRDPAGMIAIRVVDSGHGIAPVHLPLVWERFHRVETARDRSSGGAGLGLAVVRELVHGMGGRVEVESEPGRGSIFTIRLLPPGGR